MSPIGILDGQQPIAWYRTWKNNGWGKNLGIATSEVKSKKIFDGSDGKSSVVSLYLL